MEKTDKIVEINPEELKTAEEEAALSADTYVHEFRKPFTFEDRTYETLTFEFGRLTGNDDIAIEAELQAIGKPIVVAEMSGDYLVRMAARACTEKIGADMLKALPMQEFRAIRNKARSFLLRSGL